MWIQAGRTICSQRGGTHTGLALPGWHSLEQPMTANTQRFTLFYTCPRECLASIRGMTPALVLIHGGPGLDLDYASGGAARTRRAEAAGSRARTAIIFAMTAARRRPSRRRRQTARRATSSASALRARTSPSQMITSRDVSPHAMHHLNRSAKFVIGSGARIFQTVALEESSLSILRFNPRRQSGLNCA